MVFTVRSLGLHGISGYPVSAECDLSSGLPAFTIVGLPDAPSTRPGSGYAPPSKTAASPFPSAASPSIWLRPTCARRAPYTTCLFS